MANAVDWIELQDFSPGIHADTHGGIAATSRGSIITNGAATIDGTYRCCADGSGALTPLPAATTVKSSALLPAGNANASTAFYPADFLGAYLMDATVLGPIGGNTSVEGTMITSNGEGLIDVYAMWQFIYSPTGAGDAFTQMMLGRVYHQTTGTTNDFMWDTGYPSTIPLANIPDWSLLSANLESARTALSTSTAIPINVSQLYPMVAGVIRRNMNGINRADAIPAAELALTTYGTDVSTNYSSVATILGNMVYKTGFGFITPSPAAVTTMTPYLFGGSETPQVAFTHQDRTGFVGRRAQKAGSGWAMRDSVHYRAPLDVGGYSYPNGAFTTQFGGENTTTVGVVSSQNTDELLLVRHNGGGVLIRGDLDNPTIVRLRAIASTYGISSSPINTPIGLIYGTRNGVYLWAGGESTTKLSDQIDGFFWQCGTERYEAHRARFGYLDPWVMVPNNYMFDTRTKSWWRLADPADRSGVPYNVYVTDPTTGKVLAFPYKLTAAQNVVYDVLDDTVLTSSYSWRSQPLLETLDRVTPFQEIGIVASTGANTAACTVTVTLSGHNADGSTITPSAVSTFTFTGTGTGSPVIRHKQLDAVWNAQYVRCRIEASAVSGAAPKIHQVRIGKGAARGRNPIESVGGVS